MKFKRADPPAWCAHAEVRLRPPVCALCHGHCAPVRSTRSRGQGSVPRGPPSHAGGAPPPAIGHGAARLLPPPSAVPGYAAPIP
jgi:hypothetical protein